MLARCNLACFRCHQLRRKGSVINANDYVQMFGYNKVRYRSLEKNTNRLYLLAGFTNFFRAALKKCLLRDDSWREQAGVKVALPARHSSLLQNRLLPFHNGFALGNQNRATFESGC